MVHNQQLDDPAIHQEDDAFNRWPFSERLADTIANFDASAGEPVIGIYGKWGSGKTSVLHFLKAILESKHGDSVVLHSFNPWLFKDPETLLRSFFAELDKAMQKSSKSVAEKFGKALQDYSGLFGLIPVVGSGATKLADQTGKALTKNMEEVRDQVRNMMKSAERKVIVLIDDLDRLDRDEVLQMLKLVRLTANFPNVVYVLAFDDEMVSRAITQKYGSSDDVGRQFLEKIVQYPFTLPATSQQRLMEFVEQQARSACAHADIVLREDDWQAFRRMARECLARRLTTPRQAIRYGNALRFALPMMKGEVSVLDQMAVEGMRVLYPALYAAVRDNKETFTCEIEPMLHPAFDTSAPPYRIVWKSRWEEDIQRRVDQSMEVADADEKKSARALAKYLFETRPPLEQGVVLGSYFDRYFSYGIANDQIGDLEIGTLTTPSKTEADMRSKAELLARLIERNAAELVKLLLLRLPLFDMPTALAVARLVAANVTRFMEVAALDHSRVAFLLAHLVLLASTAEDEGSEQVHVADGPDYVPIVEAQVIEITSCLPLTLALDFFDELSGEIARMKEQSKEGRFARKVSMFDKMRQILSRMLQVQAEADWRSMMAPQAKRRELFLVWNKHDTAAQREWLAGLITEHPEAVAPFLCRWAKDEDEKELDFSYNQARFQSAIDMETLLSAAKRTVLSANGDRDATVVKAFLAWAETLASKVDP